MTPEVPMLVRAAVLSVLSALVLSGCGGAPSSELPGAPAGVGEVSSPLDAAFRRGAREYQVPEAVLRGLAWVESRGEHHAERSMAGGYGVMQLVQREDWDTLAHAARLLGVPEARLKVDPEANVLGAAAVLRDLGEARFREGSLDPANPADWFHAVSLYAGLQSAELADDYADQVFRAAVAEYGLVADWTRHRQLGVKRGNLGAQYPGTFRWQQSPNYSPGRTDYRWVLIHTTQGGYSGAVSWLSNPSANVSAHYVIRSSDGQITQLVQHEDTAWHAQCYNSRSIGIEHEGFVADPAKWYTDALYTESAKLVAWICDRHNIPKDRSHVIAHVEVAPNCNTGGHTDPGTGWNWTKYMGLVGGSSTTPTPTTGVLKGVIYQGGSTSNRVSGAEVKVGTQKVTTGTDGLYVFNLAPGSHTVTVSKAGFTSNSVTRSVVAGGTEWGSMEINSTGGMGTLAGRVYAWKAASPGDRSTPVTTATVTCEGKSTPVNGAGEFSCLFAPGTATASITAPGYQPNQVTRVLTAGGTVNVEVGLQPSGSSGDKMPPDITVRGPVDGSSTEVAAVTVAGTATDDRGAVAEVQVTVNGGAPVTAPVTSGLFSVPTKLSPGANTVRVTAKDVAGNVGEVTVTVTFRAGLSGFIYQTGDEAARVGGATVSLLDVSNSAVLATGTTGPDGSFGLDVARAGDMRLVVKREGFLTHGETVTLPDDARLDIRVPMTPGEDPVVQDLRIDVSAPRNGMKLAAEQVSVFGTVHGIQPTSVEVNGVPGTLFGADGFAAVVPLSPGENVLEVIAHGLNGEVLVEKLTVTRVEAAEQQVEGALGCAAAPAASAAWWALGLLPLLRRLRASGRSHAPKPLQR
jgi:N-acetyl-anhydromuramyl-L-alanine amidase AmpD